MSAPVDTKNLPVLLLEAWKYWRRARETGDILAEDKWLEALNFLLDRSDMPRR